MKSKKVYTRVKDHLNDSTNKLVFSSPNEPYSQFAFWPDPIAISWPK